MAYKTTLGNQTFTFDSVKDVLACANEQKSGDVLAGIAAKSELERVAAKILLADMPMSELRENPVVPYEQDEITRMDQDRLNLKVYDEIKGKTVGEFREWLLSYEADENALRRISRGLTAEMIAGVAKLMSNLDLIYAASKIRVSAHCNTTIGLRGTLATRLQPNHTTDNLEGITASVYEGLSYGCGDALIGLNPVNDDVGRMSEVMKRFEEIKQKHGIPTQTCVLGHITTQIEALKTGMPVDLIFQSIAGSEKGNLEFGFTSAHIEEALSLLRRHGTGCGPNVLYFETGQGSELSAGANFGADQVTMEARCYAFARNFSPFMVNTVVGFIGPEYLYDSRQIIRAGLEDHFMGKLSGLPMGCDCCYTNHMLADQNDVENLSVLLSAAGVNYIIGVPAGDDIMLNYQTNSYHDSAALREMLGLRPIPEFEQWLERRGIMENGRLTAKAGEPAMFIESGGAA
ncbi:MAG: Ethanolamine ammonia-lyase heavy chain [Firmicutes bacterium ADurb.Bin182]|nr:MAG: Ethanolamine ammonia-lyase heavy chain [Firmicutes bacterium ADurb.Bin182]